MPGIVDPSPICVVIATRYWKRENDQGTETTQCVMSHALPDGSVGQVHQSSIEAYVEAQKLQSLDHPLAQGEYEPPGFDVLELHLLELDLRSQVFRIDVPSLASMTPPDGPTHAPDGDEFRPLFENDDDNVAPDGGLYVPIDRKL